MPDIVAINPRRRGKNTRRRRKPVARRRKKLSTPRRKVAKTRTYGGKRVMPKRRKKRASKAITRRRTRRANPRRKTSRTKRRSSGFSLGTEFRYTLNNIVPTLGGMLAGAYAAKRFTAEGTGGMGQPWDWKSYAWCIGGGWLAGTLASIIVRGSKGRALRRHGLLGGALLAAYIAIVKEGGSKSSTVASWFSGAGTYGMVPGAIKTYPDGNKYMLGEDYEWYPMLGEIVPESLGQTAESLALPMGEIVPETLGYGQDVVDEAEMMQEYVSAPVSPFSLAFRPPGPMAW